MSNSESEDDVAQGFSDLDKTFIEKKNKPRSNLTLKKEVEETMATAEGNLMRFPMMYSLGMIATTLDPCTGKDIERYLEKLEQRSKLDGWTEEDTVKLLRFKCVGEAHNFLKSDSTLETATYGELKKGLLKQFAPTRLPGEKQLNLSRCYQRQDEDVSSFVVRLKTLGAKVLQEDLQGATAVKEPGVKKKNQNLLINQFKVGLRRDLFKEVGMALLGEKDLTLDKAEELVRLQETTLRMLQGRGPGPRIANIEKRQTCYHCGRMGHLSRDCRSKRQSNDYGRCFNCNGEGHWAKDCPSKCNRRSGSTNGTQQARRQPNQQGPPRNRGAVNGGRAPPSQEKKRGGYNTQNTESGRASTQAREPAQEATTASLN